MVTLSQYKFMGIVKQSLDKMFTSVAAALSWETGHPTLESNWKQIEKFIPSGTPLIPLF